ncbi:hypothetical protein EXIGLDRAFT_393930 [Exidia glandulosa HHB12029]|uniref:Uncharacterized protein n=1 Tax=Exidia glandulosa HHB12029 TaxID=1314781 RepID=A0A165KXV4_EXIGL|nr:hypothetical protein EXIGLDRAFT_393930 [Exidia glandulosa HHB12029]
MAISCRRGLSRECVDQILRYHLVVPEERFFSTNLATFAQRQTEASHNQGEAWDPWQLLLVSKAWRAVGERHLYHTVVVRTQDQAQCLMDAFRDHPALGGYVCRLRLEGSFGVPGAHIIHFVAASLEDLWLDCTERGRRYPGHITSQQASVLSWLNPRRVVLYQDQNGQFECAARRYLLDAIPRWSRLVRT